MDFIDAATKLSQGGIVVILLSGIIAMGFAIRHLFKMIVEMSNKVFTTVEGATKTIETHTRAVEANARASEANRAAIETLKDTFEIFMRQK